MSDDPTFMPEEKRKPLTGAAGVFEAMWQSSEKECERLRTQLAEAAAFLDALAGHLEQDRWLVEITAADCRAMVARLRGPK